MDIWALSIPIPSGIVCQLYTNKENLNIKKINLKT